MMITQIRLIFLEQTNFQKNYATDEKCGLTENGRNYYSFFAGIANIIRNNLYNILMINQLLKVTYSYLLTISFKLRR